MRITLFILTALAIAGCAFGNASDQATDSVSAETTTAATLDTTTESDTEAADMASDSELATNFTMTTLQGDTVSLDALRGRYVFVNFWATWCIPCRKEMPYMQSIAEKHSDQLIVLGINVREDAARVQPFVDELALTFPILLDPADELLLEHNVRGLPVSFVVDPNGQIVYRRIGEILPDEFDAWLAENL